MKIIRSAAVLVVLFTAACGQTPTEPQSTAPGTASFSSYTVGSGN